MGLTYSYSFRACATVTPAELLSFLQQVEQTAQTLGFSPTVTFAAELVTDEQRLFSRRLTRGLTIEDPRLGDATLPVGPEIWWHDRSQRLCVLGPRSAAALVMTDERGQEAVFGFFRYPSEVRDVDGNTILTVADADLWSFADAIKTPDHRYRTIVQCFAHAGYLVAEKDDYPASADRPR